MHHDDGPYLPARLALLLVARHFVTNLIQRPGNFARSPGNRPFGLDAKNDACQWSYMKHMPGRNTITATLRWIRKVEI